MIGHKLSIGQVIWDDAKNQWGIVTLINGKVKDRTFKRLEFNFDICYTPCFYDWDTDEWIEQHDTCKCTAQDAYPLVPNVYFGGEMVCIEINKDEMDADQDYKNNYDYYCPERQENCWKFEIDNK